MSAELETGKTELEMLQERATKLGITYRSNTGAVKLSKMIDKLLGTEDTDVDNTKPLTLAQRTDELRKECTRLVRVVVTCMNPTKREYSGEIFTVGNSTAGSFKKFVPFNEDAGYHIPNIIFKHLQERECQIFVNKTNPDGSQRRVGKLIKEFAITVLPPLTATELKDLAEMQALNRSID